MLPDTRWLPRFLVWCLALLALTGGAAAQDASESYELRIAEEHRAPAGREMPVLTVNGGIPGPTLHFTEGETAHITVHNDLTDQETSVHWHGLLVPNVMDGVPYLTTPPIPPGGSREYTFPLRQAGTYWYHSHTALQEQRGVYGAIVIHPREPDADLDVDREHVVVLSDWTNERPAEVMRTLMRGLEWYGQKKGTAQSLYGAWKRDALGPWLKREWNRMPAMDISDVAYDAFLANGLERVELGAAPGERVRLRIVNAGASTYFHLTWAAGPLSIVASDGQRVQPVEVQRLLMGMAETYDVVVTMPDVEESVELRATAQDSSGHASIVLGRGPLVEASDPPRANLYTLDASVAAGVESMRPERGVRAATADRPFVPYALLEAPESTAFTNADGEQREAREITMRLTGDMRRYRWGFDGKTLGEETVVPVIPGEVLRITLVNDTMMHHPLHLHGHFFRVLNGKGERSPLKHTVDVPPMGKRVIEFEADEEAADWFFHCHLLYHMDAGMARVFSYRGQGPDHRPSLDPKLLSPTFFWVNASVQSHMTMGQAMVMRDREDFMVRWDTGLGQEHEDREVDLAWQHYFDKNLRSIAGYRFTNMHGARDRAFAGVRYRLPFLVQSEFTLDSEGDLRLDLQKEILVTTRLAAFATGQYDTNTYAEWEAGLGWTLSKRVGIVASYHSDHRAGVGLSFNL